MLALLAVIWLRDVWVTSQEVEPIAYSEFLQLVQRGKVGEITIRGSTIAGTLTEPLPKGEKKFITTRVDPQLADELAKYNVKFRGVVENTFFRDLLSWIVPALVFFALWAFLIRRMAERQGGLGGGFMDCCRLTPTVPGCVVDTVSQAVRVSTSVIAINIRMASTPASLSCRFGQARCVPIARGMPLAGGRRPPALTTTRVGACDRSTS